MHSTDTKRALVFFFKNVHVPILLPIHAELKRRGYDAAFCLYPYQPEIRAGFPPEEEKAFREQFADVPFVDHPRQWNADVSFMADNTAQLLQGCGRIVNVGHGLLSKGQYFTDRDIVLRENQSDLLCVPGPYMRERLLASGKVTIPVEATGFPKLDALFAPDAPSRDDLFRMAGLDPAKQAVLYAPTFNMELSAIPILWMRIAELASDNRYLLIKLHGSTLPEFKQAHRELSERHPNVLYVEDPDIAPYLRMADVLVSDVSSVFMEFIALDKPVVLFNNPNTHTYVNYDPRDIEYAWRGAIGLQAGTLEEVKSAVERSFAQPEEFTAARKHHAEQLLADRSGQASANVLDTVERLFFGRQPSIEQKEAAARQTVAQDSPGNGNGNGPGDAKDGGSEELAGRLRMARHFARRGNHEKAQLHLEAALAENPCHPEAVRLQRELQPDR
jgi:hypothetical protein